MVPIVQCLDYIILYHSNKFSNRTNEMGDKQLNFDLESLHNFLCPSLLQFFVDDSLEQTTPIQLECQPTMLEPAQPTTSTSCSSTSTSSLHSNALPQAVYLGEDPCEVQHTKRQKLCNSECGSTLQNPGKHVGLRVSAPPKSQLEIEQSDFQEYSHRHQLLYSHMGWVVFAHSSKSWEHHSQTWGTWVILPVCWADPSWKYERKLEKSFHQVHSFMLSVVFNAMYGWMESQQSISSRILNLPTLGCWNETAEEEWFRIQKKAN